MLGYRWYSLISNKESNTQLFVSSFELVESHKIEISQSCGKNVYFVNEINQTQLSLSLSLSLRNPNEEATCRYSETGRSIAPNEHLRMSSLSGTKTRANFFLSKVLFFSSNSQYYRKAFSGSLSIYLVGLSVP